MPKRWTPLVTVPACGLLFGCAAVGPDYVRPATDLPPRFVNAAAAGSAGPSLDDSTGSFWQGFNDPVLDDLISRALAANRDIRVAAATLRQARGQRSEVRGGLWPSTTATASARHGRLSVDQAPGLDTAARSGANFDAGFDAAWELDLFGGVRRSLQAAAAGADAAESALAGVQLSVAAEVARAYVGLRGLQQRLAVAQANLDNQAETLRVTEVRLRNGRGTAFDVARIRVLVEATRAAIPALQAGIAAEAYALALLTAQPPGALQPLADSAAPVPVAPAFRFAGNPADLLRRRPDVQAAEHRLQAAVATVGATTAQLFPSVSITGFVGVNAGHAGDLGRSGAFTYGVGPGVRWNLLDFGRIRARIEQADAQSQAALARYEHAVLDALRDTETALVGLHRSVQQADALSASAEAARTASRLARVRFDTGATDLLALLDAQRQVLAAEDQLAQATAARSGATVAVFKALGGGWTAAARP